MAEKFEEPKFEKPPEEKQPVEYDKFEKKGELHVPKEERGHLRSAEEVEKLIKTRKPEKMEKITKEMEEEKAQKEKIKEIKQELTEEAGKEKEAPKESFKEVQNRLLDKLEKARTESGEKLSWGNRNEMARDFYLGELGYSLKYKGLFHGKAEVLDSQGKAIVGEKGKAVEFKTSFSTGKETPLTDFLKEKLKNKIEGGQEAKEEVKGPEFRMNAMWWRRRLSQEGFQKYIPDKDLEKPMTNKEAMEYFRKPTSKDRITIPKGMKSKEFLAGIKEKFNVPKLKEAGTKEELSELWDTHKEWVNQEYIRLQDKKPNSLSRGECDRLRQRMSSEFMERSKQLDESEKINKRKRWFFQKG